jgi:hypothetical protein
VLASIEDPAMIAGDLALVGRAGCARDSGGGGFFGKARRNCGAVTARRGLGLSAARGEQLADRALERGANFVR